MAKHDSKARPEREDFFDDAAETLSSGYTLIVPDVIEIAGRYGYSAGSAANTLLEGSTAQIAMEERGVSLKVDKYRNTRIFRDGKLDLLDTDLEETKARIILRRQNGVAKRVVSIARQEDSTTA